MKKISVFLVSLLLLFSMIDGNSSPAIANQHDVELWNVVKPLDTTISFLNTGAHPDDERSDLLAYLSRGLGVKTSSLIANRGEGGQNEIGDELGNALGIIRTHEMIEAAKITGVKAYHLSTTTSDSIYDFGFEKTPEETLKKWGEELTYERLIYFIRSYQPDIIMPSFRNVDSQHGHHRTITILTEKAFKDAANPKIFPNQLKNRLKPWQTEKMYLPAESKESATLSMEIGKFDKIYNMSYPQLGEASRFLHKSQGMGKTIPVEPRAIDLELIDTAFKAKKDTSLFTGIPYNFSEWSQEVKGTHKGLALKLTKLQKQLEETQKAYPNREKVLKNSQSSLKQVRQLLKTVDKATLNEITKVKLMSKLQTKELQLQETSYTASSIEMSVTLPDTVLSQGEEVKAIMKITNRGTKEIEDISPSLVADSSWKIVKKSNVDEIKPGKTVTIPFTIKVPKNAKTYHPYETPALQAAVKFKKNGTEIRHIQELKGTVAVLPEFSLTANPEAIVVNTLNPQKEIAVTVKVKNYQSKKVSPTVKIQVPKGWTTPSSEKKISFTKKHEIQQVKFLLTPSKNTVEGTLKLPVTAEWNGKVFSSSIQEIDYEHIGEFYFESPTVIQAVAFELKNPKDLKVGYIESGFDTVADAMSNAGMKIEKITDEIIRTGDLSKFDTIVVGIRAYLSREELVKNNDRLLKFVENGGNVVVQYHKPNDKWDAAHTAPYKLVIGNPSIRWRVTDENAKVTVTKPDSTLFSYPNKIVASDWDNWVQERGLYYPMEWAPEFETFVSMADPNEKPFEGGILMAKHGKGSYIYTNLVLYRQVQSHVPGGYRILTNLISNGSNQ